MITHVTPIPWRGASRVGPGIGICAYMVREENHHGGILDFSYSLTLVRATHRQAIAVRQMLRSGATAKPLMQTFPRIATLFEVDHTTPLSA